MINLHLEKYKKIQDRPSSINLQASTNNLGENVQEFPRGIVWCLPLGDLYLRQFWYSNFGVYVD